MLFFHVYEIFVFYWVHNGNIVMLNWNKITSEAILYAHELFHYPYCCSHQNYFLASTPHRPSPKLIPYIIVWIRGRKHHSWDSLPWAVRHMELMDSTAALILTGIECHMADVLTAVFQHTWYIYSYDIDEGINIETK